MRHIRFVDAASLRQRVRGLVRALGVLDEARTPCGLEVGVRAAYALDAIAVAEASGRPLSQSDLQAALSVDKSNVTRLVQQLATDGYVEPRASELDARVRLLHLTARGQRVVRKLEQQSLRRFERVMARIPARERDAVFRALDSFRAALEADAQREES
jgi:putative acetyltransferase